MEPFTPTSNSAIGSAPPRAQIQSSKVLQQIPWRLRSHAAAEHSARQTASSRTSLRLQAVTDRLASQASLETTFHANQIVRDGHYESSLVAEQASKTDPEQPSLASVLEPFNPALGVVDVCVVGCGPAGLALASELGANGVSVALIGPDVPFVNNYGVWKDEFRELGLEGTLDHEWKDAMCYFGEGQEVRVGRGYGRVCRRRLRDLLLQRCKQHGVRFRPGEVTRIGEANAAAESVTLKLGDRTSVRTRLVTLAAGAAAGKFLKYEENAPMVAAQTAYGIEVEVEGYEDSYDASSMLFMDFRRHHSGTWRGAAPRIIPGEHPVAGEGLWGTRREVPSFLYAMPTAPGRVFLEETCLVAKPALPFATLKRRLHRRLDAMGIKVTRVLEEEWSYIPVGGPLPLGSQTATAFGAAANLVHPATGYSIARSLREAPGLARDVAAVLRRNLPVRDTAAAVWESLWPAEKRRQAAFHVFGMELLVRLDLAETNAFFRTFFRLPDFYWRGFLASSLSSAQLIAFALLTFVLAPAGIQLALMRHLITHPAGSYLIRHYLGINTAEDVASEGSISSGDAAVAQQASTVTAAAELPNKV
ncbi:Lycopene epsilon cyclase, chloroplastic [Coccomyxa sp. Obi]|nr:Lycopene epsilon cyclase, chloroplastic [Coccomyxa sp. Obi]